MRSHELRPGASLALVATCCLATLAFLASPTHAEDAAKEKPEFPPFEKIVTKDAKKLDDGFMVLYQNSKTDGLFLEVPKNRLGKEFLLAISISGGGPQTGFQWSTSLLRWEMEGKNLILVRPEVRHATSKSTVKEVVERTYTDSIMRVLPIKTKTAKGHPVVDFGALLKSDLGGFSRALGGGIKSDLSRFDGIKNFKENTEIHVKMAAMSGSSGSWGAVHYSFSALPGGDYKSRVADDRIGYFQTVNRDWGKKHSEETAFNRYINRWHLKKKDPSLTLSPPEEPIVFYIEKTVPVPFRRYVKEGILEWNKAYEECGFIDAIVVRQQDENQFADLDPEDVRYNFFRWIVSGRAFAMGPSRVNPRTGQILDADIIMDDSFARYFVEDYLLNSGNALNAYGQYDPKLEAFLEKNPEWRFELRESQLVTERDRAWMPGHAYLTELEVEPDLANPIARDQYFPCQAAEGMVHQLNLMRAMLAAKGKRELPLDFIGQILKEVVMHEVGHTLGLRHNFRASAWKDMKTISSNRDPNVATVASVMDYNGAIFTPKEIEQGDYITRTLGPYDIWAIGYGYKLVGEPHKNETEMLAAICSESGKPEYAFATDEDTSFLGPDPHINRYDMSSNNIDFARQQITLSKELLADVESWAVEDGESWVRLRGAFNMLIGDISRVSQFVARYVGGQYVSRSHKGDKGEGDEPAPVPIRLVPAEQQRAAVDFIASNLFAADTWQFPPSLLSRLAAGRFGHWESDQYDPNLDFDLSGRIASLQSSSLFLMLNPATLTRLYDSRNLAAPGEDHYSAPEHFEKVTGAVWSELDGEPARDGNGEYIPASRRALQRAYLRALSNLVLAKPGERVPEDIQALARITLQTLNERIGKRVDGKAASKLDAYSRAHLTDSHVRVQRALEATYQLDR